MLLEGIYVPSNEFINMRIQKTFEQWLKQFDSKLHIEPIMTTYVDKNGNKTKKENPDVEILMWKNKRVCSVPKGLKGSKGWTNINDKRGDQGYETSDGIPHRSLSGIGIVLRKLGIINQEQFAKHFISRRNKEYLAKVIQQMISGH